MSRASSSVTLAVALFGLSLPSAHADAFADGIAAYDRGDFQAADALLEVAAGGGNMRAAMLVGGAYKVGLGVPPDPYKSGEWMLRVRSEARPEDLDFVIARWRAMAESGNPLAQVMLGLVYTSGIGVPTDNKEAFRWVKLAADQGNAQGQTTLSSFYSSGIGVRRSDDEAFRLALLAAEQGDAEAQVIVAGKYLSGHGVKKDRASAAAWYLKSAEQGNADGMYELAVMYDDGNGVDRSRDEALRWYRAAAAGGSPLAQNNLAVAYLQGDGLRPDAALAFQFSTLATLRSDLVWNETYRDRILRTNKVVRAQLGSEQRRQAAYELGEKCRDGSGVPKDPVLAYAFMDMAAYGEPDAKLRDERRASRDAVAATLRFDQVNRAQTLSRGAAQGLMQ